MKTYTNSFSIGNSCYESWQQMSATEQGRFCMNCQKEVIDFSSLTDQEVLRVMGNASGSVCGRFRSSQLNRPMTMVSYHLRRPISLRTIIAGIVMLTVVQVSYESKASVAAPMQVQTIKDTLKKESQTIIGDSTKHIYKGRVLAETDSLPAAYAFIAFNGGEAFPVDSLGRFELVVPDTLVGKRMQFDVIDPVHMGGSRLVVVDLKAYNYDQEQVIYIPDKEIMMMGIVVPDWDMPKEKKSKKKDD